MTANRKAAAALSVLLLVLLARSLFAGAGDWRTRILLAAGVLLGSLYTVLGRLPDWLVEQTGGSITADDDPSNISPRIYLPILLGVILVAIIGSCVVLFVM